jgi:hypothetical protein
VITYYYFFYRQCEEIRGKYGKVKTTAEQLESGIPEKLSETHTGEPFLRYVTYLSQGSGSALIQYGSGSNIYYNPGSGFRTPKLQKKS